MSGKENEDLLGKIEANQNIKDMEESLPLLFKFQIASAKLMRNYYITLIREGFTPDQALQIVIKHGTTPPCHTQKDED